MSEIADHIAVLMIHAARKAGGSLNTFVDSIQERFEQEYNLTFERKIIEDAFNRLHVSKLGKRIPSSLAGDLIQISSAKALEIFGDQARAPGASTSVEYDERYAAARRYLPLIEAYVYGGEEWVKRVLEQFESLDIDGVKAVSNKTEVPASDRLVTLDHNSAEMVEIKEAAAALKNQLAHGNDLGNLSLEGAAVAIAEVEQIQNELSRDTVRVGSLMEGAKSTLGWVGKDAAGALVGTAALALLALIASFLGYSL